MLHLLEVSNVLNHHLTQGTLSPASRFNEPSDFSADRRVVEYAQIHIEQSTVFGAELIGQIGSNLSHVGSHRIERLLEGSQL